VRAGNGVFMKNYGPGRARQAYSDVTISGESYRSRSSHVGGAQQETFDKFRKESRPTAHLK
jgi:hypothetical protein